MTLAKSVPYSWPEMKQHGFTHEYWDPASVDSVQAIVKFFDRYLK